MIHFCLIVNKQGRVRIRRTYQHLDVNEREVRESEIITKCLSRASNQCSFFTDGNMNIAYKKFTTLYIICGVSKDENELAIQELMNVFMDCLVSYFNHVSELDIVYNMERVYTILDEVIVNGCISYTSKERTLIPLQLLDAGS